MKKTNTKENNEIIEIPVEEAPYALPDGWKWVRLGDLYEINPKNVAENDIESAFIPMEKIKPGMISEFSYDIQPWFKAKKGHTQFADGDVAFAKITPCFENRKSMMLNNLPNGIGAGTTELIVLRQSKVLQKYTFWLVNSENFIRSGKNTYSGTVGQQRISMDFVRNYPIPLPPLETQKRIVDRIESLFAKLDEAKEKAQTALDTFELRKSAILHKAFTGELTAKWREENNAVAVTSEHSDNLTSDPTEGSNGVTSYSEDSNNVTPSSVEYPNNLISVPSSPSNNPNQSDTDSVEQDADKCEKSMDLNENFESRLSVYNIATLKEISQKITDGEHKTPKRIESFNGFYLLSARNIHDNFIKLDDVDYVDEDEFNRIRKRCNPDKGDILISCSGSVGRVCVIQDTNKYVMVRSAAMIKLRADNSFYVSYILQSPNVQKQIDKTKKQSCQANLFLGAIAQLRIPLPPLPEQQEIVRILDDLLAKENAAKEAAEAVIDKIDLMKKSILARAFRGEL